MGAAHDAVVVLSLNCLVERLESCQCLSFFMGIVAVVVITVMLITVKLERMYCRSLKNYRYHILITPA